MPRAASSAQCEEVYMCSLVESSPFHRIITGAGPDAAAGAWLKYAGSVVPSYGTATRDTSGSRFSIARCASPSTRRYTRRRPGDDALCIRSALHR